MKTLAVITARGGSKRIPKKNIKPFLGKPIIVYSIEAAKEANCFDEIMVSTDDAEIASISSKAGASIPFMRSEKTSNDFATTQDVIEEVLAEYKKQGKEFDSVCIIYPTAPFITADILLEAMNSLVEKKADTVVPIVPFSFPPQRGFAIREGMVEYIQPEYRLERSQDLEQQYHDCGQFYCINVAAFENQGCLIMKHTSPLILDELKVQDIDNEVDWSLAELKYSLLQGKEKNE